MIRFFLLALLMLAAGAVAAFYLRAETGYVLVSYHDWIVETSQLGLILSICVGFMSVYYGLKLIKTGERLPARMRLAISRRAADHPARHLTYPGASLAAQRMDAPERRDHYLRLAAQSAPDLEFATLLTQSELQRERGEHQLVRDTALK